MSPELIRLCIALLMFIFTVMDVVESYNLTMPTHKIYKTQFKVYR